MKRHVITEIPIYSQGHRLAVIRPLFGSRDPLERSGLLHDIAFWDRGVEGVGMSTAIQQPVLSLDRESHVYTLGDRVLPSVTEILKGVGMVDDRFWTGLGRWRGSAVHLACWYDDQNDLNESTLDPQLRNYVDAYRKFKAETGFVPTDIEAPLYNDLLGYAGTPDRVGKLGDGRLCLPDLKSGASSKVTRYQTVAYAACLPSPRKYVRMEIRLQPNGRYSLQVYEPKDYDRDFRRWQSIIDMFWMRKELNI